jgi:ribonuclease BN (tRNA processing enzyme)
VAALAKEAEIFIHECPFPIFLMSSTTHDAKKLGIMIEIQGVKRIVLTHLYPQVAGCKEEMSNR